MTVVLGHSYAPRGGCREAFTSRHPEVLLSGCAGTGKAQPLTSRVLTPTGEVPMGDLAVGDLVIGGDGRPTPVVGIPFEGDAPLWRVTFDDGATVDCSDGHLWAVHWKNSSNKECREVLSLAQMMGAGLRTPRRGTPVFCVDPVAPVEFTERDVVIPPYTLGVLLGDGYLRPGEVGFTSGDPELAERVRSELPEGFEFRTSDKAGNAAKAYRIVMTVRSRVGVAKPGYINQVPSGKWMVRKRTPTSPGTYVGLYPTREEAEAALETVAGTVTRRYQPNAVQAAIEDLGLTNARSATKFVPDLYKYNSVDVRWEVLRGLMDTDGYTEPHPRNQVSYTSISQRMAGDVEWLVASLGGTSRTTTKQPKGGQLAYTVWISLNDRSQAFHLARKRDNCRPRVRQVVRRIVDAQPLGTGPARCITVANSDGLYVTDHFVVTHNSRALLERLLIVALKYPGMRGLIVRKTLSSLGSTALVTWREHVAKEAIAAGVVQFYGGSPAEAPQYRFNNGSVISVGGIDRPSRIMSMELDVCYVQEAVELDQADFEAITTRLRNGVMPYQQILADTNPDTPTHWLKVRADLGTTKLIESRHGDNPLLVNPDGTRTLIGEAYISKLDALTGVRKQRLRHGLWVATEGMVYEEYDPAVHLVDRFYIPRDWVRYWTVDFGFTNPFCWQNWAISPDGIAYLDAEIYMTRRTVDQHAKAILRAVTTRKGEWTQGRPRAIICDHDAEGRAVLERELGMSTSPARKAVLDGIQAVQMRLRDRGDGKRGLYLMRDAVVERDPELVDAKKPTCTADELPGYIWDTGAGKSTKEQPWKHDDHGADALRYLCTGLDEGRPRVRMMSYR